MNSNSRKLILARFLIRPILDPKFPLMGKSRYHLVDWHTISRPYDLGGWNIKNLDWFSIALRLKSVWIVLKGEGIWSLIINHKYLKNWSVVEWFRTQAFNV